MSTDEKQGKISSGIWLKSCSSVVHIVLITLFLILIMPVISALLLPWNSNVVGYIVLDRTGVSPAKPYFTVSALILFLQVF